MHAVNDVVQPFSQASLRFVMENVPVDQIFGQRPEENTEQKNPTTTTTGNPCLQRDT